MTRVMARETAYRVPRRFITPAQEPAPYGLLALSFTGHLVVFFGAMVLSTFLRTGLDQSKIYIVNLVPAETPLGSPAARPAERTAPARPLREPAPPRQATPPAPPVPKVEERTPPKPETSPPAPPAPVARVEPPPPPKPSKPEAPPAPPAPVARVEPPLPPKPSKPEAPPAPPAPVARVEPPLPARPERPVEPIAPPRVPELAPRAAVRPPELALPRRVEKETPALDNPAARGRLVDRPLPLPPPAAATPLPARVPEPPRVTSPQTLPVLPATVASMRSADPVRLGRPDSMSAAAPNISLDVNDFPFTYYLRQLKAKVEERFAPPRPVPVGGARAIILFEIGRDGQVIKDPVVERSSGNTLYDQAALRAVTEARPFPPLPPEFKAPSLRVHFGFDDVPEQG